MHQNDSKYIKKLIFNKKINFFLKHEYNRVFKHSLKKLSLIWFNSYLKCFFILNFYNF